MNNSYEDELTHYASPYYDPVKAHEYYEAHKQLKGRTSTAGLNDSGKEAAKYVKDQLTNERKSKAAASTEEMKTKIESSRTSTQNEIKSYTAQTQAQISRLSNILKKMKPGQRKRALPMIRNQIAKLRQANSEKRATLMEAYKKSAEDYRTDNKNTQSSLKEEYDNKYVEELEKIKNTDSFKKTTKSSSKSSSDGDRSAWYAKNRAAYEKNHKKK